MLISLFLSVLLLGALRECVKSMGCDVLRLRMHLKIKKVLSGVTFLM